MTQSNARGGYIKSLEINREGSHTSITTLRNELLKKANHYVCQIPRFITNTTPRLNLIDEVYVEILKRNDEDHTVATTAEDIPASVRQFKPQIYRTYLELARQLEVFCKKLDAYTGFDNGLTFCLLDSGMFTLTLSGEFATAHYLKFGAEFQKHTGFRELMFHVFDGNEYFVNSVEGGEFQLIDVYGYFEGENLEDVEISRTFQSARPLSCFDHRLSQDIVATFPISTTTICFDGTESHDFLLARFPLNDYVEMYSKIEGTAQHVRRNRIIQETVNLGLEDLCRQNPNTINTFLLPGELRHCNFTLQTRYLSDGKITSVSSDFTNGGFWSLKLLFSKKVN